MPHTSSETMVSQGECMRCQWMTESSRKGEFSVTHPRLTLMALLSRTLYSSMYWSTRVLLVIGFQRTSNECPPTLVTERPVGIPAYVACAYVCVCVCVFICVYVCVVCMCVYVCVCVCCVCCMCVLCVCVCGSKSILIPFCSLLPLLTSFPNLAPSFPNHTHLSQPAGQMQSHSPMHS